MKTKIASLPLGVVAVSGINLISFVGKHRETLLVPVVDTLVKFYRETVATSTADKHAIYCAIKALRSGLLSNIKRSPTLIDWNEALVNTLEKLCMSFKRKCTHPLLAIRHVADRYRNHKDIEAEESDPRLLLLRGMPRMKPITPQLQLEMQG